MKKLASLSAGLTYILSASKAYAADITISPPKNNGANIGYVRLGDFISNVLVLAFGLAVVTVLIFIVWGAFDWITSGGEKEAVGKARNKIVNALIGLAVLAVAFALANVAAQFLGFPDVTRIPVPTPPSQ